MRPYLGFDLRFHADYEVTVPFQALAGAGGQLQAAVRVTPLAKIEHPTELVQRFALPDFPAEVKGEGMLAGGFDLGLGSYRVDWMIRDRHNRACTAHWSLEARPERRQKVLPLTLNPNTVAERTEGLVDKIAAGSVPTRKLHIKILLNMSPFYQNQSILAPADAMLLLAIVRGITDQPDVNGFDLLAFNIPGQKIVYQRDNLAGVDDAALEGALLASRPGTIDYHLLLDPRSETKFVTELLTKQLSAGAPSPDAIVIVGSKLWLEKSVSLKSLKERGPVTCPIYYLNYNPDPTELCCDTIRSALKAYTSAVAYDLLRPGDLAAAIKRMFSR